ncbi:hypothetical protein, partial [Escherichia coli]|uniref:hypothetical protein n=1 Tax=Escherichia coli TaxID=562 RepID=UPI001BDD293C
TQQTKKANYAGINYGLHCFSGTKTRSSAGCKNYFNVRHKTPIVVENLPQIREKSTTLSRYLL